MSRDITITGSPVVHGAHSPRVGWSLVLLAATLWGTTGLIFQVLGTTNSTSALSISFLRLALSVPFSLLAARLTLGRWAVRLGARGWLTLTGVGAGMALYQITYVLSIERVGVALATLISICGAPIFVALISWLFLGKRYSPRVMSALGVAVVGAALLVGYPTSDGQAPDRYWQGIAIAIACAIFQALFVLAADASSTVAHPIHSVGIGFGIGALLLLPFATWEGLALHYDATGWAMLLYVAVVPTSLAQTMFLSGLRTTGTVGGAVASLLEPLVAAILAVVLLGERIGLLGYTGGVILLAGIALMQRSGREAVVSLSDEVGPRGRVRPTVGAIRREWQERLPAWMQPFLTWLMGYPYPGQKALLGNKPWWIAVLIPTALLAIGLVLSVGLIYIGGWAWLGLPIGWLLVLNGARTLQVHICHQGIHDNLSGNATKDRIVVETFSTLLVVQDHDGYKNDHDGIHHPSLASDHDPDRQFTIEVMKIEPGNDKNNNKWRFLWALISPKTHARFLAGRFRANFITCPAFRRLMSIIWLVAGVAVFIASQKWAELLLGCVLPMTILYHMSAMCQFVTEHFWARRRHVGQTAKQHYLALLVNRHLGDPLPKPGLMGLEWWSRWMIWWMRLFLYHIPVRLGILVADLPVHGSHHLWPLDKRWTNAIYTYHELAQRTGKSPIEFVGSYGEILDFVMASFSEGPPSSNRGNGARVTVSQAVKVTSGA